MSKKILAIALCILIVLSAVMAGCSEKKDNTEDRTRVEDKLNSTTKEQEKETSVEQTKAPTEKPTEAPTEKPTEKPVVSAPIPLSMLDFKDYTIEQVIDIYGNNYIISEYLYLGGAGYFWYNYGCPYTFYFKSDVTTIGTIPSFKDKLLLISTGAIVNIDGVVSSNMSGAELESLRPGGSWYENADSGYWSYNYEVGSCRVSCMWQSSADVNGSMDYVEIFFT